MLTDFSKQVLNRRYLKRNKQGKIRETFDELFLRIAKCAASAEKDKTLQKNYSILFYKMLSKLQFVPNSPTIKHAGEKYGQLSACFVIPINDSMEGIFESLKNSALIHQSGGGVGFSFSKIRPYGDIVNGNNGVASGPISFMKIYNESADVVTQTGLRKGANMGILRIDHPNILEFIAAKTEDNVLNNFNISVAVTNKFMKAVENDIEYEIINPRNNQVVKKLKAKMVFDKITNNAWKNGDPGIFFIDEANIKNPISYIGEIEATNPCGETILLPYSSCNLGSIDISKFVKNKEIDYSSLKKVIKLSVRFLDNIIDVNVYPLKKIEEVSKNIRQIGLGIMGFADMLIKMGIEYGSSECLVIIDSLMSFMNTIAFETTVELGHEKGSFPLYDCDKYKNIYDEPNTEKLRNSSLFVLAPTGTISLIAGCSSGIEPIYAPVYKTIIVDPKTNEHESVIVVNKEFETIINKYKLTNPKKIIDKVLNEGTVKNISGIPKNILNLFKTAHEIEPKKHVEVQARFQKYVDNAISKTINFPNSATVKDIEDVYINAWKLKCKGITIYRDGSREIQALNTNTKKKENKSPKKINRPNNIKGTTYTHETGCGKLYITINNLNGKPFEVFVTMGKAGGCASSQCEGLGRLISLTLREDISIEELIKQLSGISCYKPRGFGKYKVLSCSDAISKAIQKHTQNNIKIQNDLSNICPECGGPIDHSGGCTLCLNCGFSECS